MKSRQLGIRAKLFFAFAAVSGTTVIAGAAAWLMFSQVRDLFHGVAGRNIPEIVETLGLADRNPGAGRLRADAAGGEDRSRSGSRNSPS